MAACAGFGDKVRRFNQGEYFGRETGTVIKHGTDIYLDYQMWNSAF